MSYLSELWLQPPYSLLRKTVFSLFYRSQKPAVMALVRMSSAINHSSRTTDDMFLKTEVTSSMIPFFTTSSVRAGF